MKRPLLTIVALLFISFLFGQENKTNNKFTIGDRITFLKKVDQYHQNCTQTEDGQDTKNDQIVQ